MNLESGLNEVLELLLSKQNISITAEQLIHCLDLTLLDENASIELLMQLNKNALKNHVAAICVYSEHLSHFHQLKTSTQTATVINFPRGEEQLNTSLTLIKKALISGASEIDYVFPYPMYLNGNKEQALKSCHEISLLCKELKLILKIIIETGAFSDMQSIYEVSTSIIESGCDFLKTSTGKIPQGASLSAAFSMLRAIKDSGTHCGIKLSGGIKTPTQAFNYAVLAELMMGKKIEASWFRIGASGLLNELLKSSHLEIVIP